MASLEDAERLLLLDNVPYGDDDADDEGGGGGGAVEGGGALLEDTPSPPVILEDGDEDYLEYHYESMVEKVTFFPYLSCMHATHPCMHDP